MTVPTILAAAEATAAKDVWDKLEIVGGLASGVVVACLGGAFTWMYNRAQSRTEERRREEEAATAEERRREDLRAAEERTLREGRDRFEAARASESDRVIRRVDVVRSLLPDLKSESVRDRRAALLAVRSLGDLAFAADLARIYGGPAGVSALVSLSLPGSGLPDDRRYAEELLAGLTRRLRHSVALVSTDLSMGSGFAIAEGLVVTASHVIGDATTGRLKGSGAEGSWTLVHGNDDQGLALLTTDLTMVPLRVAADAPNPDDDILLVGWDGFRGDWVARAGTVLGPDGARNGHAHDAFLMPAEVGSVPGFSGAPALNSSLEVVAVHLLKVSDTNDAQQQGLAQLIALQTLRTFLREHTAG